MNTAAARQKAPRWQPDCARPHQRAGPSSRAHPWMSQRDHVPFCRPADLPTSAEPRPDRTLHPPRACNGVEYWRGPSRHHPPNPAVGRGPRCHGMAGGPPDRAAGGGRRPRAAHGHVRRLRDGARRRRPRYTYEGIPGTGSPPACRSASQRCRPPPGGRPRTTSSWAALGRPGRRSPPGVWRTPPAAGRPCRVWPVCPTTITRRGRARPCPPDTTHGPAWIRAVRVARRYGWVARPGAGGPRRHHRMVRQGQDGHTGTVPEWSWDGPAPAFGGPHVPRGQRPCGQVPDMYGIWSGTRSLAGAGSP